MELKKVFLLLSLGLIPFSFNCQTSDDKHEFSSKLLVYVEARDGINTGCCGYGDIVVYDLENNTRYKITDDEFYDADPKFSPDGKFILFRSNRSGSAISRDISGVSGPWPYIYNLETGNIEELRFANFNPLLMIGVRSLIWGPDSEILMFIFRNKIMQYSIAMDSMMVYKEFPDSLDLYDIACIDNYLCWRYEDHEDFLSTKLIISDFGTKKILDTVKTKYTAIIGKDNNELVLYGRLNDEISLFTYDIVNQKTSIIIEDIENSPIGYVSSYNLFFSSQLIFLKGEEIIRELAIYDLSSKSLTLLTQDNKVKKELDVYIGELSHSDH